MNVKVAPPAYDDVVNVVVGADPATANFYAPELLQKAYFPSIIY